VLRLSSRERRGKKKKNKKWGKLGRKDLEFTAPWRLEKGGNERPDRMRETLCGINRGGTGWVQKTL